MSLAMTHRFPIVQKIYFEIRFITFMNIQYNIQSADISPYAKNGIFTYQLYCGFLSEINMHERSDRFDEFYLNYHTHT